MPVPFFTTKSSVECSGWGRSSYRWTQHAADHIRQTGRLAFERVPTMIQHLWETRRWPVRSGIYFADENVVLLDISMPWETKDKKVSVSVLKSARLDDVNEFPAPERTHLIQLCEQPYPELKLSVIGGEAAHGSEGFIAVTDLETGKLVWLAYFNSSNPFESVSVSQGLVTGVSNLGHKWNFPINQPETVKVFVEDK
jgi:hypothetical protein